MVSNFTSGLRPRNIQTAAAVMALSLGVIIYLLTRDQQQVLFLAYLPRIGSGHVPVQPAFIYCLPSLLHTYAFILLTSVVMSDSLAKARLVCVLWFSLECLFEIGQHEAIAARFSEYLGNMPFLNVAGEYFLNGTFDWLDIAAIAMGACLAYATVAISVSVNNPSKDRSLS